MNEHTKPQHDHLHEAFPPEITGRDVKVVTPKAEQLERLQDILKKANDQLDAIEKFVGEQNPGGDINKKVDRTVADYVGDAGSMCRNDSCLALVASVGIMETSKPGGQPYTARKLNDFLSRSNEEVFKESMTGAKAAGINVEETIRDMDEALTEKTVGLTSDAVHESASAPLEFAEPLRKLADDLMAIGVSRESIISNGTDGLELYQSIINDNSTDNEARQRALDRVVSLYRCDKLDFGGRTFDRALLYSDTPSADKAIESIRAFWHEADDVGYDSKAASGEVKQWFDGRYIYNGQLKSVESRYEELADRMQRNAKLVRATKGKTLALSQYFMASKEGQDYVLQGFADDTELDPSTAADILEKSQGLIDSLDELSVDKRTIIEQTNILTFESARNLLEFSANFDRAKMIAGFHEQIRQLSFNGETQDIVHQIYSSVEKNMSLAESPLSLDDLEAALQDVFAIHEAEPAWNRRTIFGMLGVLENSEIREVARDARMCGFLERSATEANLALETLEYRPELDWNSALDVYEMTDKPFDELVKAILSQEPQDPELVSAYYRLLKKTSNTVDKNGIPYSTPRGVRQALESPLYTDERMQWFVGSGDVSMVMFDAVVRFRDTLVSRGVKDESGAIYEEFCNSPELIAEESAANLERYVGSLVGISDSRVRELIEAARANAESRKEIFAYLLIYFQNL